MKEMARPLRIVRIIDRLNIGGPAKHVVWLTAELRKLGFETTLITGTVPPGEGDMSYFADAAGVEPVVIKEMSRELTWRDAVVVAKLLLKLWKLKPDIVHTHKAKAGATGRVAAALYKWLTPSALWLRPRQCRIIHTYHGHIFHGYYGAAKTRMFLGIERTLARFCTDRIIAISRQQRAELHDVYRVGRADQYRVIPLGIDLHEAAGERPLLRKELGLGEADLLAGIVGRLCEVKNHAMLLEAAAQLGRDVEMPRLHFVVIGDGPLRQDLEAMAHRLGLSRSVTFAGFRRNVVSLYSDLDLIVLSSVNEGTPLTLIEAMSCGRPVVATQVGGVVDIIGARRESSEGFSICEHGIAVRSGDADALARALVYAARRPGLRHEMGQRGRAFVRAALSKDRLVSDIEELYKQVQSEQRPFQTERCELSLTEDGLESAS